MFVRAAGRVAPWPAALAWPALLGGAWLMAETTLRVRDAGDAWSVALGVRSPPAWLQSASSWVGLGVAAAGLLLLVITLIPWRPDRPLLAMRYPAYGAAALALTAAGLLGVWMLSGHVVDVARGGFEWRFVARLRGGVWNVVTLGLTFLLAVTCYALSFGRRPPFMRRRATASAYVRERQRVPAATAPKATTSKRMGTGAASQKGSGARPRAKGDGPTRPS